ncbi:hypothetical protein [Pseudolabrys sp.]|uniref:hypothetical protein n=1 Tax=Pseudolabrys sp. TaxID=1960880 RepID=UPI003D0FA658
MRIFLPPDVEALSSLIPRFLALAGEDAWNKRWHQLKRDFERSPAQQKIVADYHWLELLLNDQAAALAKYGHLNPPLIVEDLAVLHFIAMVVEVHARLTPSGQKVLQGRLRSALGAETGFAALYLEMDIARRLFDSGNEVDFPDLEGTAQYDIRFSRNGVSGEVECKSQSADAGRKIHRKDFYRFIDKIEKALERRAATGAKEVLLITLSERLPSDAEKQKTLVDAVLRAVSGTDLPSIVGDFFILTREKVNSSIEIARSKGQRALYGACIRLYGERLHVAGPITDEGICIVVMRSTLEDDTSKPWLEAMEKAATQFSGSRASFIAVQFNDLSPDELLSPSLRRRAEILCGALFRRSETSHVTGIHISPYRGFIESAQGIGAPAFGYFNTKSRFSSNPADYPAFHDTLSDRQFAQLIGAETYRSRFYIRFEIMISHLVVRFRKLLRKILGNW